MQLLLLQKQVVDQVFRPLPTHSSWPGRLGHEAPCLRMLH